MTHAFSDVLLVGGRPNQWVKYVNNDGNAAHVYVSTAVTTFQTATTGAGVYTFNPSPIGGIYTSYLIDGSLSATAPAAADIRWAATGITSHVVAYTAGDDAALDSVTASTGPYTNTAPAGGSDVATNLRVAGPAPWVDITHPTYGAKGDGTTDDTAAIQAAGTAAIAANAALLIPPPSVSYPVSATIAWLPPGGAGQMRMDILALGGKPGGSQGAQINWTGGNTTAIFSVLGWKFSSIRGVKIAIPSPTTAVAVWELDVNATQGSSGLLSFYDCAVNFASGATSNFAWRLGHLGGATNGSEMSFVNFYTCTVLAGVVGDGNIGFQDEHSNGLNHQWFGCFVDHCLHWYSNSASAGAAGNGAASKYFYACGGSGNGTNDFLFVTAGPYLLSGGRWELGTQLILCTWGTAAGEVVLTNVNIATYAGDGVGAVIRWNAAVGSLVLTGVVATGTSYTKNFITLNTSTTLASSLVIQACAIQSSATTDPFTVTNGAVNVWSRGNYEINTSGNLVPTGFWTDRGSPAQKNPAMLTGQVGAVATIAQSTAPNDGVNHVFRIAFVVTITTLGSGSINAQVTATDETTTARTFTVPLTAAAGGGVYAALANTADEWVGQIVVVAKPAQTVTAKTTGTFTGGITYDVFASIEQLL